MVPVRSLAGSIIATTFVLMCHATAAHAGAIQLNAASELSAGGTVVTYPPGAPSDPLDIVAGGITLTFDPASSSGAFFLDLADGTNYDFPAGTSLLGTMDNGPLTIMFSTGIREVGFFAQSLGFDIEAFTFDVFQGASALGTFNVGPADNTTMPGVALFIGARATGADLITQLTISSTSSVGLDDAFVIGPVTFAQDIAAEAVPEPMSLLLVGTGLVGAGVKRWRKRQSAA